MTGSFYMMSFCPCIYLSFVKLSGKNIVTVWFLSPLFIQKGFSPLTRNGKNQINLLYTREHNVVCIPISNTQIGKNHNSICSSVQYLTVGWYFIIFEQLKNINRNSAILERKLQRIKSWCTKRIMIMHFQIDFRWNFMHV